MIHTQNLLLLNLIKDFYLIGCEFVKKAMLQKKLFYHNKESFTFLGSDRIVIGTQAG